MISIFSLKQKYPKEACSFIAQREFREYIFYNEVCHVSSLIYHEKRSNDLQISYLICQDEQTDDSPKSRIRKAA